MRAYDGRHKRIWRGESELICLVPLRSNAYRKCGEPINVGCTFYRDGAIGNDGLKTC